MFQIKEMSVIFFKKSLKTLKAVDTLKSTDTILNRILLKSDFWNRQAKSVMNESQKKLLNKILDGFEGKLTSS